MMYNQGARSQPGRGRGGGGNMNLSPDAAKRRAAANYCREIVSKIDLIDNVLRSSHGFNATTTAYSSSVYIRGLVITETGTNARTRVLAWRRPSSNLSRETWHGTASGDDEVPQSN